MCSIFQNLKKGGGNNLFFLFSSYITQKSKPLVLNEKRLNRDNSNTFFYYCCIQQFIIYAITSFLYYFYYAFSGRGNSILAQENISKVFMTKVFKVISSLFESWTNCIWFWERLSPLLHLFFTLFLERKRFTRVIRLLEVNFTRNGI